MANGHGGARPGAGRKAKPKAPEQPRYGLDGGDTPLDHLLSIMRNSDEDPEWRYRAAKDAAPYCHARLQSVSADVELEGEFTLSWDK